ncbi:AAA family ATPase [Clostridium perfringens]|uniref:AAA family ATPase n=1 Tax=Clostridium perfringens TaxID=1502 RepID=UPI001ABBCA58|nr:AAA family ATPase [Clostridium perfringens]MBO3368397.1 AAA family ATPase [Clostridium perfringens]
MIIKKINVKSFGKLKNKEIELKDGLNIIYGENESGKSTLQSFIKVMLYGVCNKRGKKTLSDRAKFTPLGEGSFSGELLVEDNGEEILIDRSFGKTKKYDEGNILNNITGEKINKYSWQEPGKDIFNLSSEGFKNTLFISQMGCIVESSKQDDVLNKIINILECGADEVSYKKIKNNLEENKKSLTNSRKTGKLDLLRIKESELLEERYKRVKIHEENIENELYLKGLKEKRTDLNLKIEELELHKKNLKKSELKNEYENINEYLNKKEKLEEELKVLLEELKDVQAICDLKKLNNLRDEFKNYEFLKESLKEKEDKIDKLKEYIYEYNEKLKSYGILNEISNNLETKLIELRIEDDRLRENYKVIQKVKEELYQLNEKKDDFLSHLNALKLNDSLVLQIEKDLEKYNNEKIYPSINANLKEEKNIIEEESKSFSKKIFLFRVGEVISILLCAFLFISYFKSENIMTLALSILGMLLFIFLLAKSSLNKKEKDNISKRINEIDELINEKKEIEVLKRKIDEYKQFLKVKDEYSIKETLEDYRFIKKELDILYVEIKEKEKSLILLKEDEINEKILSNEAFIDKLLRVTGASSIDEILELSREKKSNEDLLIRKKSEFNEVKENLNQLNNRRLEIEGKIKAYLENTSLQGIALDEVYSRLEEIEAKIEYKEGLKNKLNSVEENCNLLLKGRDILEVKNGLLYDESEVENKVYNSEEEILNEIKLKNNDLLNIEKEIKDVEYLISSKELTCRSLFLIDEEIAEVKGKIKSLEKKLKGIEIATNYMEKAFKELQKSFGPVINKKVEDIFKDVTKGAYKDLRVSEDYNLVVKDTKSNKIMDASYLSSGTYDQIYLALRLGIIDIIFEDKKVPIILDESFTQYDDSRLKTMLDIIYKRVYKNQIILFTCQKREINILKDKEKVNIIEL